MAAQRHNAQLKHKTIGAIGPEELRRLSCSFPDAVDALTATLDTSAAKALFIG
jgi:hypothetical protein